MSDSATLGVANVAAAAGIVGSMLDPPDEPLSCSEWSELVSFVAGDRRGRHLSGLLVQSVESGALPATDAQRDEAKLLHRAGEEATRAARRCLVAVAGAMDLAATPVRVLGEPALAHLDYEAPQLRPYDEVHLLVRGPEFDPATRVLSGLGFTPTGLEVRPGFAGRFGEGRRFVSPGDPDVHLHRTFVDGAYGLRVSDAELWATADEIEVDGRVLPTLGGEARLLEAACAVLLRPGSPLIAERDLAELALGDGYDVGRLREMARTCGMESVLARSIDTVWTTLAIADVLALSRWASRFTLDEDEARLLELYRRHQSRYVSKGLAALREVHGLRNKVDFAASLLIPQQEFLESRRVSRAGWLFHGMSVLVPRARDRTAEETADPDEGNR